MQKKSFTGFRVRQAVKALQAGGVIAYPTEAVYGLGCDPDDEIALLELLQIKQRPFDKGLILISADFNQLQDYILPLPAAMLQQVMSSWPGPNTWLVPARPDINPLLSGGRDTLAVRVTDHPLAASLCRAFGKPLVSTSANLTGREPVKTGYQVRWQLPKLDYILAGPCGGQLRPSTIRDAKTGAVLR
ncbi:Sua5/YciO/YrdC family protein [Methylophaga frappieri]|uniref:Threonylcarbamoyl-AMP synthase n=1 Tax=Methylophaga frappieri (strain ATCC BAA-2434 / DSM 25690 / JAM7) TaxID=754477 RepID=I1YJY7_METFJ|nr:L-threonylcarbamoyladenylate synthase [Methylophaga frappieri]AFJ03230.1 Sua5/YciO/YrdC family protein [Methylophaga frappieri]